MRDLGRRMRAESENGVDVDAAWSGQLARRLDSGGPIDTPSATWRWLAIAAAVIAMVVGGGLLLLRRDADQLVTTDGPDATGPSTSVTTVTTLPSTAPATSIGDADPPTTSSSSVEPTTTVTTSPPTTTVDPDESVVVAATSWQSFPWEGSRIARGCADDGACTQLRVATDGLTVSYDPATRVLTHHAVPAVATTLPASYGDVWIEFVGPSDIAYLLVESDDEDTSATGGDRPSLDMIAVSLAADDAGREIRRWPGSEWVTESDVFPTATGLVDVGCCGEDPVRPEPGQQPVFPWVLPDGTDTVGSLPTVGVTRQDPSILLRRDEHVWEFEPSGFVSFRTMQLVPAFDGGVIAWFPVADGGNLIVRAWPDGLVEQLTLIETPAIVEPTGVIVVANDTRFARVEVFEPRSLGWTGNLQIDQESRTTSAPGLNDYLDDETPAWALDPVEFADAISHHPAVNEQRSIRVVADDGVTIQVDVVTTNFFDDSVFGSRTRLTVERQGDGTLRFVGGDEAFACQPRRGHQDFSTELCA